MFWVTDGLDYRFTLEPGLATSKVRHTTGWQSAGLLPQEVAGVFPNLWSPLESWWQKAFTSVSRATLPLKAVPSLTESKTSGLEVTGLHVRTLNAVAGLLMASLN